jgi:hypothetical protein
MSDEYPKSSVVWPGAILGYLVNSIMTAQSSGFAGVCSWENQNDSITDGTGIYGANDSQGVYGAITFEGKSLVGIFYDTRSKRSPYRCPETYDVNRFFRGMSVYHRSLVERGPLQYFRELVDGTSMPSITAASWDAGAYLTAADPWEVVLAEGARLVRIELMEDLEEALAEWQYEYEMTPEQVAFARSLFQRKMARPAATILLTPAEVEFLRSTAEEPNENGITACREKLAAIGIVVPESPSG